MAQPVYYASGTIPVKSDTRRILLAKRLAVLQNLPGALAANNEQRNDTIYRLQLRITNALKGVATH